MTEETTQRRGVVTGNTEQGRAVLGKRCVAGRKTFLFTRFRSNHGQLPKENKAKAREEATPPPAKTPSPAQQQAYFQEEGGGRESKEEKKGVGRGYRAGSSSGCSTSDF
jgi:hypothetical protein